MGSPLTEETVSIPVYEYDILLDRDLFLQCLEDAGINNWEGFAHAQELFEQQTGK